MSVFFYYKITKTNRTQHVTIIFKSNQILCPNQDILFYLISLFLFFFVTTKLRKNKTQHQARRQDSVTAGAEINLGGGTRSLFM